ncbi:hypothetical protein ACHAQJ_002054 [Trichoderma viride]
MSSNPEWVSWYDNPRKQSSAETQEEKPGPDLDEKDASITDPSVVNLQTGVFSKVAKTFTQLFSKDESHLTRGKTRIGWTTTGELGVLRQEQDAQYEFMEELELKIEQLNKEVDQLKSLVKAYEARMDRDEEHLQHCMHWITMAQVFGDVPVAKDRMNWKSGRDAALVGASEDEDEKDGGR